MHPSRLVAPFLAVLFTSAADAQMKLPDAVQEALKKAEKIQLLSLDPAHADKGPVKDGFHGWKVLGQTDLAEADRKKVAEALIKGVPDEKGGARCFIPRHGIRAQMAKESLDLVICFECSWIYIFSGDKRETVTVRPDVQPTLDAILKAAKVPLPKGK